MPLSKEHCKVAYKVLVLGVSGVGKTAFLNTLMGRQFKEYILPTVGKDFVSKIVEVDGALVAMDVWDTAGQEQFRSICRQQYRGTQGIILVYDITDRESYTHLQYWINSIENEIHHTHNAYEPIPIILCGNKKDMEDQRQVSTEEGEMLVSKEKVFEFYETSAKTGENIFTAFRQLAFHVTDICDPAVMKSYHRFMIKECDTDQEPQKDTKAKQKIKKKKIKTKKIKKNRFSILLCCTRGSR
ncbi:hypothetical protein ACOMHN_043997 [Nucella lapillus]